MTEEKMIKTVNTLLSLATIFIVYGICLIEPRRNIPVKEEVFPELKVSPTTSPTPTSTDYVTIIHQDKQIPKLEADTTQEHLDEVQTALLYAVQPIGRYYITAYNHLETGSKQTASGATCHEGIITTCAADPKYHRFGEYLEIGGRIYRVEDTGSAVKKRHIDIYFKSYKQMARYGSHYETIYRVSFPFGKPKDNY